MNWSLKKQLAFAFGTLVLLSLVSSFLSVSAMSQSDERFRSYINEHIKLASTAMDVRSAVNERAIAARNLILVTAQADKDLEYKAVVEAHHHVGESLKRLHTLIQGDDHATAKDKAYLEEINEVESLYGPAALATAKLAVDGQRAAAIEKMNADCRPLLAQLLGVVANYVEYSDGQASEAVSETHGAFIMNRNLSLFGSAIAILIAVALGVFLNRSLSGALGAEPTVLRDVVSRVAAGDLSPVAGTSLAKKGSVLFSLTIDRLDWSSA